MFTRKLAILLLPQKHSKRGHAPPFLGQPSLSKDFPFLEIQYDPTFYRPIGETKVLNESFNWLYKYKFYQQNILILEEHLLKW